MSRTNFRIAKTDSALGFRAGLTLLEVVIYMTVVVLLSAPIAVTVLTSTRFVSEVDSSTKTRERNRVVLFRLDQELRQAIRTTLAVTNGGRTIGFTLAGGYDLSAVVAGPQIEYRIEAAPGETVNSADDNNNGLVDEGVVVRRNVTTAQEVTLCSGVDLANSGFTLNGDSVRVSLANMGNIVKTNSTMSVSGTIDVYPYN